MGLLLDIEKSDFQSFPEIGIIHEAVSEGEAKDISTNFMHTSPVAMNLSSVARGGEKSSLKTNED